MSEHDEHTEDLDEHGPSDDEAHGPHDRTAQEHEETEHDPGVASPAVQAAAGRAAMSRQERWRLAALVAAGVAVVVLAAVVSSLLGGGGRAAEDPGGRRGVEPVRELERVEAQGECAAALESFRAFRQRFSSGVEIVESADAAAMNELLAGVRARCDAASAARFDELEVQPWLSFRPQGGDGGARPTPTLAPLPDGSAESTTTTTTTTTVGPDDTAPDPLPVPVPGEDDGGPPSTLAPL